MKQITITDDGKEFTVERRVVASHSDVILILTMGLRTMTDDVIAESNDHVESRVGDTPATDR